MPQISAYEATRVPRYSLTDNESEFVTNLVGQRAFLTTTLCSICAQLQGSLELRFRSDLAGRVRIFIAIETPDEMNGEERESGIRVAERLLPQGYAWTRTGVPDLDGDLAKPPIRIARLVRAMEFVDVPPVTLAGVSNLIDVPPAAGAANLVMTDQQRAQSGASTAQPAAGAYGRAPRELPPLFAGGRMLSKLRLCLPILGPIGAWHAEARVLMEELVASRPAVVSIHLRPTFPGELDKALPAAALWRLFLKEFLAEIAGSGIADPRTIIGGFARYALPPGQLAHISIRCAAQNDRDAIAVASVLAACLGGARSFSIIAPTRDVLAASLRNIWLDYPREHLTGQPTDDWTKLALEGARQANVLAPGDPEAVDLLSRAPHLFTIDEAQILAQLPISGEDGLPGVETEMVPPFYGEPPRGGALPPVGPTMTAIRSDHRDASKPMVESLGGRVRIGRLIDRHGLREDGATVWHHIPLSDLSKHALVVGSTGSGKTVATSFLLTELARLGIPFLVIEPVKTEYYSGLRGRLSDDIKLRRFRFEGDEKNNPASDFLPFDPMYLQEHVTVSRHASYLKSCFEAAFPLDPTAALILENGIRQYYTVKTKFACCLDMFSRGGPSVHKIGSKIIRETVIDKEDKNKQRIEYLVKPCLHPSLDGFMSFFLHNFLPNVVRVQSASRGQASELLDTWTQMFERRFDALQSGMIGIAAQRAYEVYLKAPDSYDPFSQLLNGNVVLELDGIPDDEQKALMMAFISAFLFERRQADDFRTREAGEIPDGKLKHIVVIEEAHRLLANVSAGGRGELAGLGAKAKSVSAFVDMLAEIRAFGQGLVIVEQIPTKIVPEAVKNTNLKIMLRLTAADDREFLGAAMNLTEQQKRFVTSLRADGDGVSMVVFEQQLDQPRLLKLPFDA